MEERNFSEIELRTILDNATRLVPARRPGHNNALLASGIRPTPNRIRGSGGRKPLAVIAHAKNQE